MKRAWIAIAICVPLLLAAAYKEFDSSKPTDFWLMKSGTLTKVFELLSTGDAKVSVSGAKMQADNFTNAAGTGAPTFPSGLISSGTVKSNNYSNSAGTGAPDFPNGLTGSLTGTTVDGLTVKAGTLSSHVASGTISLSDHLTAVTGKKILADAVATGYCSAGSASTITLNGSCSVYYTSLATNTTVTFSAPDGQQVTWVVYGNGGNRTVTVTNGKWRFGTPSLSNVVYSGHYSIFTFMKIGTPVFVAALDEMY